MTSDICGNEVQPSLRDSSILTGDPALKRRAIFNRRAAAKEKEFSGLISGGRGKD
jgi:hypothetical protein